MKFVREQSKPISGDSGLKEIQQLAELNEFSVSAQRGSYEAADTLSAYVQHLMSYVDVAALKPLKIVVNAGNGGAGRVIDALEPHLPFEFIKLHHEADGHFPNGVPNPLLPENRAVTADMVRAQGADLGLAWDGDFDRCFFFDHTGAFIDGEYVVGLLAEAFLAKDPGATIIHDPRIIWNTLDLVAKAGWRAVQTLRTVR